MKNKENLEKLLTEYGIENSELSNKILALFGVIDSKPKTKSRSKKAIITLESYSKNCDIIKRI